MNAENFITINGRQLSYTSGETILEVAKRNSIFIPTLCHLQGARPTGACRICVVEVAGARALVASCTMPAAPNMEIKTDSPAILEARRTVVELLLSSGNHNCSARSEKNVKWTQLQNETEEYDKSDELCAVYGACKLQALAYRYQADSSVFCGRKPDYSLEDASSLIIRDFSRCIMCGRCVQACNDAQVNNAISYGFRGTKGKVVGMGDQSLEKSECVFCGECISACPVGALTEKRNRFQVRPWETTIVESTCYYCGVGCKLNLHIKDNQVMKVTSAASEQNGDRLCMKGRFGFDFLGSDKRINLPRIRERGKLREVSWEEALKLAASKIAAAKKSSGADAIAGVCSGKSTNEATYLTQKFFRAVVGTNNISTPCAATGTTNPLIEIEKAPQILVIGSMMEIEAPMTATLVKRAVKHNQAKLVVINDCTSVLSKFADEYLMINEGSEGLLVSGLIGLLLKAKGDQGSREAKKIAKDCPLDKVTGATGISAETLERVVALLDLDKPLMLIHGAKTAGSTRIFQAMQELLGNLNREFGGVNQLAELNNSTGAALMGAVPELLPGYNLVSTEADHKQIEKSWSCTLSKNPGLNLAGVIESIASGSGVKVLLCMGEDIAVSGAEIPNLQKALKDVCLIQIDFAENETTEFADIVLPATVWAETNGSYFNSEKRLGQVAAVVTAPGEAKPEEWIITELANRLEQPWPQRSAEVIWSEEIKPLLKSGNGSIGIGGKAPTTILPGYQPLNYHHHQLLGFCEGLLEGVSTIKGGKREWASDPEKVKREFLKMLSDNEMTDKQSEVDQVLIKYKNHRGGLIPVLQQIQAILGFLPVEVQNYIGHGLNLSPADVFGVVTFYSFFTMVPRGKFVIRVCLGTACYVKDAGKILDNIADNLKIKCGETTPDKLFSLEGVRCVGACGLAPVVVVGEDTHGMIDPAQASSILTNYRSSDEA